MNTNTLVFALLHDIRLQHFTHGKILISFGETETGFIALLLPDASLWCGCRSEPEIGANLPQRTILKKTKRHGGI